MHERGLQHPGEDVSRAGASDGSKAVGNDRNSSKVEDI